MVDIKPVSKRVSPFESFNTATRMATEGSSGSASDEESRTLRHLAVSGRSGPIRSPLESVIGIDERVRVLDTELAPWRMICALRMRSPNGGSAIGTGWFVGPRTVLTAGHCVFSSQFFGGWADEIEVVPGLNRAANRPFGSATSTRFSSIDRWTEQEDPDFDIGCVHLDDALGERTGWFGVASLPAADLEGFLVNVSGYPGDRPVGPERGNEQYHAANRVLRVGDRRVFYEVDTFGGQSGAPVWIHETDGAPPLAVAVHAYGIGGTPADLGIVANSAPRIIPEVFETIRSWIDQDTPSG